MVYGNHNLAPTMLEEPKRSEAGRSNYLGLLLRSLAVVVFLVIGCLTLALTVSITLEFDEKLGQIFTSNQCPVAEIVRPEGYYQDNSTVAKIIGDESFRNQSAAKLSGAVQVNTEIFDSDPSVEEDPEYWAAKFAPFHDYLKATFPRLFNEVLKVEKVNQWGLLLTWEGSDSSLEPIVLMAHQDVVPTQKATLDDWTYPPYSGHYDGERLWGRGSADCKNLLIGLLESSELLVDSGFKPQRTIIFAFGFDEEVGGERGARTISKRILERYGPNSIYAVVDEGGQSLVEQNDVYLALPGTSEKGALDVHVSVKTPGGHSSVPQGDHTSIGLLALYIHDLERTQFKGVFTPLNPTFHEYQCIAVHSPSLPADVKQAILDAEYNSKANNKAIDYLTNESLLSRFLISTSTAVDIINGGTKSNALPEYVEAVVNHRIAIESSVNETVEHDLRIAFKIARENDLGVKLNGKELKPVTEKGFFSIDYSDPLEPAPQTPVGDAKWKLLAGIIRHVYEEVSFPDNAKSPFKGKPVIVAPGIATGNTDTRYFWDLTKHIYRYRPGLNPTVETHAHGVDERILFDSHLQIIAFYYQFLQVVDNDRS